MDANRLTQLPEYIIDEYWQAGDVIHVRMRDDDIADATLLRFVKRNADAAGIDRDAIIDHKACKALRETSATLRGERAW